ncbi:hypothetical protein D915_007821 [Fasciola hepatica]|uniref:Large ribosomal subunit protein mL42 n=1 Tax=Fasciola hepatica TaxID=6192 RepID=A0A4E0R4N3_FASHE|nr:hypothetical protein D915_007821 [Fasciola hepatica]
MIRISTVRLPYSLSRLLAQFNSVRSLNQSHKSDSSMVVVSSDGATIVCWHPDKPVPYKLTKPITHNVEELKAPTSPLSISMRSLKTRDPRGPSVLELTKEFGVPWHHFRPRRYENTFSPYFWNPLRERRSL